ncbi:MAG: ABC transporter permease [Candidatus Hydrogenedentes bacterium]|nr:ABC transporter permease [Candidatus Hydrogenedentota bacterium]
MSLARYIWKNALRNKRRTGLTVLSIGFSLFLLLALLTFMDVLLHPVIQDESALRLIVARSTSLADILPLAYLDKIKRIPEVEKVIPFQWVNGIYKDPDYLFANFSVDPKGIWEIYSEQKISPEQKAAFAATRSGATASEKLAARFGWKVGDTITLQGTIFPVDLELKIVGIFTEPTSAEMLYLRHDYLEEALGNPGISGTFAVKASSAAAVPRVAEAIDTMFRNSPAETKTTTEKAFVLGFVSMLGNIQTIISSVAGVVVFTMLLVAVSTMAMTMRERVKEVAILKTIGFPRRTILSLVMGEALSISMTGAGLGIAMGAALRFADLNRMTQGFITRFSPTAMTYAVVLGTGLAIGILSGFFPARQAVRLNISAAMRHLD